MKKVVLAVVAILFLAIGASAQYSRVGVGIGYAASNNLGFGKGVSLNIDGDLRLGDNGFMLSERFYRSNENKDYLTGDGTVVKNTLRLEKSVYKYKDTKVFVSGGLDISHYSNDFFSKTGYIPTVGAGVNYKDYLFVRGEWLTKSFKVDPEVKGFRVGAEYYYDFKSQRLSIFGVKAFTNFELLGYTQGTHRFGRAVNAGVGFYINLSAVKGE